MHATNMYESLPLEKTKPLDLVLLELELNLSPLSSDLAARMPCKRCNYNLPHVIHRSSIQ